MKAYAFAPGHISGFFEPIFQRQNIDKSGSRGSGINISLGAKTQIEAEISQKQDIQIIINNQKSNAPVTKLSLKYLIGEKPLKINVNTILELPIGQGFGMSAAGALSATYALSDILEIPKEQAIKASHYAEVQLKTGLGDVLASSFGGIEIRREAGLPPWGVIEHIPGNYEIVLCVIGKKLVTKDILTDQSRINEITNYGRYCMKRILEKPSIHNLFSLSQEFTKSTGLAEKKTIDAIEATKNKGMASMCMLGNSIFCVGKTTDLFNILSTYGKVFICSVDQNGARILKKV
jgi:pantoate kinase